MASRENKELLYSLIQQRVDLEKLHKRLMPLQKPDVAMKRRGKKVSLMASSEKKTMNECIQTSYEDYIQQERLEERVEKLEYPVLDSLIKVKKSRRTPQFAKVGNWDSKYILADEAHRPSIPFEKKFERSCHSRQSMSKRRNTSVTTAQSSRFVKEYRKSNLML